MKSGVELVVNRMLPGDTHAKLFSLLWVWGFEVRVRRRASLRDDVQRIYWLNEGESIGPGPEDQDIVVHAAGASAVKGRRTWTPDRILSREGLSSLLASLSGSYCVNGRRVLAISFDVEVREEKLLFPFYDFLEFLAGAGCRASIFLTGSGAAAIKGTGAAELMRFHEIGNHTSDHRRASRENVLAGHVQIREILSVPEIFRAPFLDLDTEVLHTLLELRYGCDSSAFGVAGHPILTGTSEEPPTLCEVPVLDGGDYALMHRGGWREDEYLRKIKQKLERLGRWRTGFAILFHPQYSSPSLWRDVVETAKETGYDIQHIGDLGRSLLGGLKTGE